MASGDSAGASEGNARDRTGTTDGDPGDRPDENGPAERGSGGAKSGAGDRSEGSAAEGPGSAAEPFTFDDVAVVMGTYNEAAAVGAVLADIDRVTEGRAAVICVDGSEDRTPEIARKHGARVIEQEPRGYGVAVREALLAADRPVVVTTDCDDTYPMDALPAFLEAVNEGGDVVSGDRISPGADAMPAVNRLGNRAFALLASVLLGRRVHDVTTGMRAYRRSVVQDIDWTENTGLSAELLLRPALRGYDVRELAIDYRERAGETTLDPLAGGAAIAWSILTVALAERFGQAQ